MPLYTPDYIEQNRLLHARQPSYGTGGAKLARTVTALSFDHAIETVLDYGCGKQALRPTIETLGLKYQGYDPAFHDLQAADPADLVICGDVMEHVERDCVPAVLDHIRTLAQRLALFVICCEPGTRRLPNGQIAHCTVNSPDWWLAELAERWSRLERLPAIDEADELVVVAWNSPSCS